MCFDLFIFWVLKCLIGPWSFDGPKGNLVHCQAYFPIFLGGIGFISFIATTAIVWGSWALVASSLAFWFLLDHCICFVENFVYVNSNIFPFQQQLKTTWNLFLLLNIWLINNWKTLELHFKMFAPTKNFYNAFWWDVHQGHILLCSNLGLSVGW